MVATTSKVVLPYNVPITEDNGKPSTFFVRMLQQLLSEKADVATAANDAQATANAAVPTAQLLAQLLAALGGDPNVNKLFYWDDTTNAFKFLGIGTGLTVSAGSLNASATGGGAMSLITEVVTSASQASVTFSAIPATYRDLVLVARGRGSAAAGNVNLQLQFNGDTATNYEWSLMDFQGSVNNSGGVTAVAQIIPGVLPAASASALATGSVEAVIADYRGTVFHKATSSRGGAQGGSAATTMFALVGYGRWKSTAAITSVKAFLSSGNFVDGSVVSLYGRM